MSSARTNGGSPPHHQNILASNEPLSVDQAVLRAESLANQGEPDKATQFYRAVLEKFPENKSAIEGLKSLERPKPNQEQIVLNKSPTRKQINALIALYSQGRLQEALVQGTALAERYPDVPLIPNILGIVNAIMKRPEEAVTNYTKALQLEPDYVEAHNNLGITLKALGKHEEAVASYSKALQLQPDNSEAHNNLGIALKALGKHEEAVASHSKALQLQPDNFEAHNNLGIALRALGKHEEAVASYSKALQLRPENSKAHFNLGNALKALGKHEEAIASYTKALQLEPDYVEAHNNLGIAFRALVKHEEAIANYTKALQLKPDFAEAHNNLGTALSDLGKYDEAAASYTKALQLEPDDVEAHNNLGIALTALVKHVEAIASFTKALQIKPDFAEALSNLGAVLHLSGRDTEAEAACRRALELVPDNMNAYRNLAFAHRFQPLDPLLNELNRQLARQPRDGPSPTGLLEALGKAHDDLGLYDKAFSYYRKANQEFAGRVSYDPTAQREQIEAIKSAFPQSLLCPDRSPSAVMPIFVVGMSRAGKTLVESLLAQHPAVIAAGERKEWWRALDWVRGKSGIADPFPACVDSLTSVQIREMGEHYLDQIRLRGQLPDGRFYVNTMPGHYRHLGLIFRAFPSVKVIFCQRQPLDQCLSIYFKIFMHGHEYSYDLQNLAAYYLNYQKMMAYWLRLYDQQILTVQYETLVRKPLEVGRRLYAHCELDFAPAALRADFKTDQIDHAKHYEGQLAPLRAALGQI
ncbi:MAG: tetratricopeptide repeat protein [Alphaproteobacteria bacterium]